MSGEDPRKFQVRLCHVKRLDNFAGYGFNLKTDSFAKEQRITSVEPHSPAELCSLLDDDLILKINGRLVADELHVTVVAYVKEKEDMVDLLVAQPAVFENYHGYDDPIARAEEDAVEYEYKPRTSTVMKSDVPSEADEQLKYADNETMELVRGRLERSNNYEVVIQ